MKVRILSLAGLVCLGYVSPGFSTDPTCPAYPAQQREADAQRMSLEQASAELMRPYARLSRTPRAMATNLRRASFLDDAIFNTLDAAGVAAAPLTTDAEFVRRIYLDIIGRIPTADQAAAFLNDQNPDKRNALIDQLINSPAYVDNWTYFFADYFAVTTSYYNIIGIPARNQFYFFLRDFVNRDRSYKDVASDIISASGDATVNGAVNEIGRAHV